MIWFRLHVSYEIHRFRLSVFYVFVDYYNRCWIELLGLWLLKTMDFMYVCNWILSERGLVPSNKTESS